MLYFVQFTAAYEQILVWFFCYDGPPGMVLPCGLTPLVFNILPSGIVQRGALQESLTNAR